MPQCGRLATSAILIFSSWLYWPSAVLGTDISTDAAHRRQTLESWGTSLAWFANAVGGWHNEQQKSRLMDLLFDPANHLGLNFARYNIGAGQNRLLASNFRVGALVPGWVPNAPSSITDTNTWVWNWDADPRQRWVLDEAIARGVDRVEAFGLSAPYWMTISQDTAGGPSWGADNLSTTHYDEYAHYLTEVVKFWQEQQGVHFDTLSPMNEAAAGWWVAGGQQEGMNVAQGFNQRLLLETIGQMIQAKTLDVGLVGPEETSSVQSVSSYNQYNAYTKSFIDQIHTHTYPYNGGNTTQSLTQLKNAAQSEGKKLYVSEYGNNSTGGLAGGITLAQRITDDLKVMEADGWTYWQTIEPLEYATSGWGLILADYTGGTNQYQVRKQYHVMRQFTSYIRPGSHILSGGDASTLAAYDPETETTTIVVTNGQTSSTAKSFDLVDQTSEFSRVIRTSDTQDYVSLNGPPIAGTHISTQFPGTSVTTIVLHHRPNQIQNATMLFDAVAPAVASSLAGGWQSDGSARFDRSFDNSGGGSGGGVLETNAVGNAGSIWQAGIGDGQTDLTGIAYQFSIDVRFPNAGDFGQTYDADTYIGLEFYGADGSTLAHESVSDFATRIEPSSSDSEYRVFRTPSVVAPDGTRFVRPVVRFDNVSMVSNSLVSVDNAYLQTLNHRPRAKQWTLDANGDTAGDNWSLEALESNNTHLYFGDVISQNRNISANQSMSVSGLTFDSPLSYRLIGAGTIHIGDATKPAIIDVRRGSQKLQSAVVMESDAMVQVLAGAELAVNSTLELNGNTIHKQGPGRLSLNNDFTMGGGVLSITASDTAQVVMSGDTMLDGTLQVNFVPGYQPVIGDSFELIEFTSLSSFTFQSIVMPQLAPSMAWRVAYSSAALTAVVLLQGDFNADGTVDAADYVVWRKHDGQTGGATLSHGDADGNGNVDSVDLALWQANFGSLAATGQPASSAHVPEPGSAVLLLLGVLAMVFGRDGVAELQRVTAHVVGPQARVFACMSRYYFAFSSRRFSSRGRLAGRLQEQAYEIYSGLAKAPEC
jgi:O-glycosyl hydrolase